jgi:hypothetical protein
MRRLIVLVIGVAILGGCANSAPNGTGGVLPTFPPGASAGPTAAPSSGPASGPSAAPDEGSGTTIAPVVVAPPPKGCVPTDQDQYVYNPARLQVVTACLQVSGTVAAIRTEADGDLHILIALDPAYAHLLTPANQGEELGDLVVEPVCVGSVSQADAIDTCAVDADPIASVPSTVGEHIWLQGHYVFDLEHGGWAELHPLYRWGAFGTAPPPAGATPRPTPVSAPGGSITVRITSLTSPVSRGSFASIAARTKAGAACTITVEYKSGPSSAAGLGPKTASSTGSVSWTWRVGTRTTVGSWPVTVTCSSGGQSSSAERSFLVR